MDEAMAFSLLSENASVVTTKIPPGGQRGAALTKASNKDYDVFWSRSGSGGGPGGDCGCESMSVIDIIKILEGK